LGEGPGTREVAEAARSGPPAADPPRPADLLLDALATRFLDGHAAAAEPLRAALYACAADQEEDRWQWLAGRLAQGVWDDELWYELSTRGVRSARETGALSLLPIAATYRAALHVHEGEFAAARTLIEESDAIAQVTGTPRMKYADLVLVAWQGDQ